MNRRKSYYQHLTDLLFMPDALLMGQKTYTFFAQVWPTRQGEDADRINSMPKHNLVDEFHLLVFPFTFGDGPRIFERMGINTLKLLDTKTFSSGVVALIYQPANG